MSTRPDPPPSQEGESKEGAGRVALFRETGLLHLYTVESNYNAVREAGVVPPCSGDRAGRASPPSGKRPPMRMTPSVLQVSGWGSAGSRQLGDGRQTACPYLSMICMQHEVRT